MEAEVESSDARPDPQLATLTVTTGLTDPQRAAHASAWVAEDPAGRARISRSDVRRMLQGGHLATPRQEQHVNAALYAAIAGLLAIGVDVIVDDAPDDAVDRLPELARDHLSRFQLRDLSGVTVGLDAEHHQVAETSAAAEAPRLRPAIRGERLLWIHVPCGDVRWFLRMYPPDSGCCGACGSLSPDVEEWQPLYVGRRDADLTGSPPVSSVPVFHFGRTPSGHAIEDGCPCVKAACGLVATSVPSCNEHSGGETILQSHLASEYPGAAAERHTP